MSLLFSLVFDWWLGKEVEKTKPQVLSCGSPGCSLWIVNSLRANLTLPKIKIAVLCEHIWSDAIYWLNAILFAKLAQTGRNVKDFFAKCRDTAMPIGVNNQVKCSARLLSDWRLGPDPPLACPLLPLKKGSRGWDKKRSCVPLKKGDLGGSMGNKQC